MTTVLRSPRMRITLETPAEEEYLEVDVQTDNRDLIQWDAVRARRGWPATSDAPMLWSTFIAWHAAHRTGGPVPDTFDKFNGICVAVQPIDRDGNLLTDAAAEEDDGSIALPTSRAPEPASSSSSQ